MYEFFQNMSLLFKYFVYGQVAKSNPEKSIPLSVLKSAQGLAILTVVKAGALVSYKVGTGLVVARRYDGSWSAPSAILSLGLGWGAQVRRLYVGLVHV
jgi:lipid-binding SYLF domain-containing protein